MQKHMAHLQQLKDYDERLAQEREELARHEQERKRIEVMRSSLHKNTSDFSNPVNLNKIASNREIFQAF